MDLRRKLTNNKNLYEGYIPYQDNHRDTYYTEFVKQFAPAYPKEDNILRILTNEDFIVNNDSFYIVFLGDSVTTKYANCFKFHFVQNFLVNWDEYKKYIYLINPKETRHLSVSSVSAEEIYANDFDLGLVPREILFSDIQFIQLKPHEKGYRNGYFRDIISSHIQKRGNMKLITVILFCGTEEEYNSNSYDSDISMVNILNKIDLCGKNSNHSKDTPKKSSSRNMVKSQAVMDCWGNYK